MKANAILAVFEVALALACWPTARAVAGISTANPSLDVPAQTDDSFQIGSLSSGSHASEPGPAGTSACGVPAGLTGWWPGDGHPKDLVNTNDGILNNGATYTPGKVGQAFFLDGVDDYIEIPNDPALHSERALTVTGWFKANSLLPEWQNIFWKGEVPDAYPFLDREYALYLNRVGLLHFASTPRTPVSPDIYGMMTVETPWNVIRTGEWYHFAAVIDSDQNCICLYLNGELSGTRPYNLSGIRSSSGPLRLGSAPGFANSFCGAIDEVCLFNRALTAAEIQAIYLAGSSGFCGSPVIFGQPQNQSAAVGSLVKLSVSAGGAQPLSYQWQLNGSSIPGATGTDLVLDHVQSGNAGRYSVVVSNALGSALSSDVVLSVTPGGPPATTFTRITVGSIATDVGSSHGIAWGDYDNDGNVDLFVANVGPNNFLYHNNGDGTFTRITTGSVVNDGGDSTGAAWGDYDNDGHLDLFVANGGGENDFLYHNNGDGTFTKIPAGPVVSDGIWSYGCAWADYDRDGYLDLYVCNAYGDNRLYHNNGDGTFTRVITGSIVSGGLGSVGCAWGDYDNDGYPDLFVTNGGTQRNFLFHNNGDGTFTRLTSGAIVNDTGASTGCAWGDYDNDGYLDLFVANRLGNNFLYHNNGDGTFTRITSGAIAEDSGDANGCTWGDYDNDGYLDLFVANWNGQNNSLYHNNHDGTFTKITAGRLVNDGGDSVGAAWTDYNNDGFLDLVVGNWRNSENNFLYRNDGNANNWLKVKCVGVASNRSAIGAKVKVRTLVAGIRQWQMREISGGDSFGSQSDLVAHFGLGGATNVEVVRIEWPSGKVQELQSVAARQTLVVTETPSSGPLPTAWLEQYFGPNYATDPRAVAYADPDGDGANNYQEFLAGTNPLDANSLQTGPVYVSTYAGSVSGYQDGPRTEAKFDGSIVSLKYDSLGRLWLIETSFAGYADPGPSGHRIRILGTDGRITTLAGAEAGLQDGPANIARFSIPDGLVFDSQGNAFVVERANHRVRKIDPAGNVSTFAGSTPGYRDGIGADAQFDVPIGVAIDKQDNLFVADFFNLRVRKITPAGEVTTYSGGTRGYQDGDRTVARYDSPNDVAMAPDGSLYVADWTNGRIRKISPAGQVTTLASGLNYIERVAVDPKGTVYASAGGRYGLFAFAPDGTQLWSLENPPGYKDGPASQAQFQHLQHVVTMPDGNLLVGDELRVRLVSLGAAPPLTIDPAGGTFTGFMTITMTSSIDQAEIRYTLNGEDPTPSSTLYTAAFGLGSSATVKARLFVNHDPVSDVVTAPFTRTDEQAVGLLQILPESRSFTNSIYVLMTTTNSFGVIRYTLDNSVPASSSLVYTKPVRLTNTTVVSARLFFNQFPISDVVSATFTAGSALPDLQFIPDTPLFTNSVKVQLAATLDHGTIRFTLDGSDPGPGSPIYSTPIRLDKLTTVKAQVFLQSDPISDVASLTFARVYALNDGIPASWREHFFGPGYLTDPRVAADGDPDGDGATNWQEYLAGTNPTDPLSVLRAKIKAIPMITWDSISNRVYRVVRKDSVISTNWVTILDNFRATNSVSGFIDTEVADPASFYSVEPVP